MSGGHFDLVIDPTACDGHGLCAELLPESIRLDPWGFPVIDPNGIPPHLVDHAQRAAASCPKLALTLVKRGVRAGTGQHPPGSTKPSDPVPSSSRHHSSIPLVR